ncbi:hypothetical protein [Thermogemmatispora sp.]|uniref:hypothetical protein n=1 Tax=Thermogemmatispora sp. TaxID=1968838 RepID=UPI0035E3FF9B
MKPGEQRAHAASPPAGPGIPSSGAGSSSGSGFARRWLPLTAEQAAALRAVLEGYRQAAFQQQLPTTERNERLRQSQALLARLLALSLPPGGQGGLSLSPEELDSLRQVLQGIRAQPELRERWRPALERLAAVFGWDDG